MFAKIHRLKDNCDRTGLKGVLQQKQSRFQIASISSIMGRGTVLAVSSHNCQFQVFESRSLKQFSLL